MGRRGAQLASLLWLIRYLSFCKVMLHSIFTSEPYHGTLMLSAILSFSGVCCATLHHSYDEDLIGNLWCVRLFWNVVQRQLGSPGMEGRKCQDWNSFYTQYFFRKTIPFILFCQFQRHLTHPWRENYITEILVRTNTFKQRTSYQRSLTLKKKCWM